jgi:hypothetical protein
LPSGSWLPAPALANTMSRVPATVFIRPKLVRERRPSGAGLRQHRCRRCQVIHDA